MVATRCVRVERPPASGSALIRPTPCPVGRRGGRSGSARMASSSRSISPSTSTGSFVPSRLNSLMPLSPKGLCEAEMTAPGASRRLGHRGHAGGRQHAEVDDVGPLRGQAGREGGLQQRARAPGVAADDEGRRGQHTGRGAPEGERQLGGQLLVRDPADAVGAEAGRRHCSPACYRLEYCGALRAFFRPYFFDSFSRASRVRRPARLSGAAQLGVELAQAAGDAEAHGAGLARDPAAVDGGVDVVGLGRVGDPQRLGHQHAVGRRGEVLLERAAC